MKNITFTLLGLLLCMAAPGITRAHDTWVQANTNLAQPRQAVHVDLMLGNHHNNHRDYRLMGKVNPNTITLRAIAPDGQHHDLKPALVDMGSSPKTGYWTAMFQPQAPGLYMIAQTSDQVVHYAPLRSIKSAKTFFVVAKDLNNPPADLPGYGRVLGHPLELVPQSSAITGLQAGKPLEVRLLLHGQPLADVVVSFIPRSGKLQPDFDETYERRTDEQGMASFTPTKADYYLIVAHHKEDSAKGQGYEGTKYAATLVVQVSASKD